MTAKGYLMQVKRNGRSVSEYLVQMGRLCREAKRLPASEADMLRRIAGVEMFRLKKDMDLKFDEMLLCQRQITADIARIPDDKFRELLTLRYLCGMRWEDIALQMHYSTRHLHRLHKQALACFEGMRGPRGAR